MKYNTFKITLLLFAITLVFSGCSRDEDTSESYESVKQKRLEKMTEIEKKKHIDSQKQALAVVGGKKIYEYDLENGDLHATVTNEVLYQVAIDRAIDKEIINKVANYERKLILDIIKDQLKKEIQTSVTEEEINSYYNSHKDEYTHVIMEELATTKEDIAYDVRREALKGTDFKSIPKLFNTENNQNVTFNYNSSVVGIFFSDAIKIGQISQVIDSDNQYLVQKVISKREPTFEELKDIISLNLTKQKAQNSYDEKIETLKKEKNVEILVDEKPATEEIPED